MWMYCTIEILELIEIFWYLKLHEEPVSVTRRNLEYCLSSAFYRPLPHAPTQKIDLQFYFRAARFLFAGGFLFSLLAHVVVDFGSSASVALKRALAAFRSVSCCLRLLMLAHAISSSLARPRTWFCSSCRGRYSSTTDVLTSSRACLETIGTLEKVGLTSDIDIV